VRPVRSGKIGVERDAAMQGLLPLDPERRELGGEYADGLVGACRDPTHD
jgi:hypothetical protein